MGQEQVKYLQNRLNTAKRQHIRSIRHDAPTEPAAVTQARKLIDDYEESQIDGVDDPREDQIEQEAERIKETILFGDPRDALNAVKAFEAKKFTK